MKFFVYLLISLKVKKRITYVGYTSNLKKRLKAHNSLKGAKFTRGRRWKIIYKETYDSKSLAMKAEYKLKKNYYFRKKIKENYLKNEH